MKVRSLDNSRLLELDFSRNLATIFILLYHFIVESNTAGYINSSSFILQAYSLLGSIGVNLFFLLSGVCLNLRWQNRWNPKEYAKSRVLAIYPDFWVVFFALFGYGEVLHGNNASIPKWKIIFSIIGVDGYIQQFTSTFYKIGEWFLGCLLILYFLFPIFRHFVFPNRKTFFWGAILFLFWLIGPSLCLPYDGDHMVLGQAFVFWIGMLFSQLIGRKYSCKQLVLCGVICGVLALLYVPTKYIAFFSAIFIMLFAGVSTKYLKKFPHGIRLFIHFFSKQSYRIFLIHHVLLVIIVVPVAILYAWHPIFTFTTYFIFCIVLATILGYISQPLASLLKALLNH